MGRFLFHAGMVLAILGMPKGTVAFVNPPQKNCPLVRVDTSSTFSSSLHMVPSSDAKTNNDINIPKIVGLTVPAVAAAAATAISTNNDVVNSPIAESFVAAAMGVATVSSATAAVDKWTSGFVPPFNPKAERFDQSTFHGRFCKMFLACDPLLLLYSKEEVFQYKSFLDEFETGTESSKNNNNNKKNDPRMDRSLWEAKRIVDAALHPETSSWIPRPFRMSGYLPYNGPICISMVDATSTASLLFWSWLNQSQNALVNYHNRNSSSEMTNVTLLKSYAIAVISALLVAFGLSHYVQSHFTGEEAVELLRFVAFPSAVIASSLNCFIVRSPEIDSGVPLLNDRLEKVLPDGETSCEAAKRGVFSTTASRAILQMPVYFIPPLLLDTVEPIKLFLEQNPSSTLPITTYLLLVSFGVGLPATVGMFPQMSKIDVSDVEEKYQNLVDPQTGETYTEFFYNKGL
mmetsp:Transcript_14621/g.20669  ORF Transcript_14621/g.20669 Transcript_14621/m.20669 type:complete len:459 (-) Transcript_14621:103-1479(-)